MMGLPISAEPGASTESMRDAITGTEYAFYTRDFNGMRASRDSFRQLANDQEMTTLAHYYTASADYRLALGDLNHGKNQRIELLNSCIAELNLVLDQRSGDADALEQALLIAPEYDWVHSMLDTIGGATDGQQ